MNNIDQNYHILLQEIYDLHQSWSNDELDRKLKEYYNSIPPDLMVSSIKLNQIIMDRFPEGLHYNKFMIKFN
jgi:hypothetical protein